MSVRFFLFVVALLLVAPTVEAQGPIITESAARSHNVGAPQGVV